MYCKECGKEISDDIRFCEFCGVAVASSPNVPLKKPAQQCFSHNIVLCDDDIYRWTYSMNMWKNPTILITLCKVLFISGMFPVLLVTIFELIDHGIFDALSVFMSMFIGMLGFIAIFIIVSFPIIILLTGGRYQVVFELDDKGVNHIQMAKQFKKNQVVSMITVLAGAALGSSQVAGAGLLAGSKQNSYSDFKKVVKIVAKPSRHVIYVNERLAHNQVYVAKEDFEQVKAYILKHCPKVSTY